MNGRYVLIIVLLLLLVACAGTSEDTGSDLPAAVATEAAMATAAATATAETPAGAAPTPDPVAVAQAELTRLQESQLLYNPPQEMRAGVPSIIEARLTNDTTLSPATLTAGLGGEGEPIIEPIQINSFVSVRLIGDAEDFRITPRSSEEQIVTPPFTEWEWEVTPLKSGRKELTLLVTARIKIPGFPDERKDLVSVARDITVRVNPAYSVGAFLSNNWEWVILGFVLPSAAWVWRQFRPGQGE